MKNPLVFILPFLFAFASCLAQESKIDKSQLRLKGLKFDSEKKVIIETFGKPKKTFEPKNECGFRSEAEQGKKYYQLTFDHLAFLGNESEKYGIEFIEFSDKSKIALQYGKFKFDHRLTIDDLIKIFGKGIKKEINHQKNGNIEILVNFKNREDGLIFNFKSGNLVRIDYWSPC